MPVEVNVLADLGLFRDLHPDHLAWLSERLRERTVPAGMNIIHIDQPGEVVYLIVSGTVKVYIHQGSGLEVILAILGRGDTLEEMSLLDSAGRSANAVTLEVTRLVWMDRKTFQEALKVIPPLSLNLIRLLSARVRLANEQIQALATLDVYGRVARQLLAFADKYGAASSNGQVTIPIQLTQGDIGDLVGASRKRVNQVMVAFKQQGLVRVNTEGRMVVTDRNGLARYCR